jgi:hypothetical protein
MNRPDADWDFDMTKEQYDRLHPDVRSLRCHTSLQRKIEFLESNERNGEWVKLSLDKAKNLTQLRNWHDGERRLWRWADPLFVKKKSNKDLMDRWQSVIELLLIRRDGGSFQQELDQRDKTIDALRTQVDQLIEHNRLLQKKYAHLVQR